LAKFFLGLVLFLPALVGMVVLWCALVVVLVPGMALVRLAPARRGRAPTPIPAPPAQPEHYAGGDVRRDDRRIRYDRAADVSKLYGCNTRNVEYRWSIFREPLDLLRRTRHPMRVLDFGAGSLRDTFELCGLGASVVAIDANRGQLEASYSLYDWRSLRSTPVIVAGVIDDILDTTNGGPFDLVTAFDVIEHLHDVRDGLSKVHRVLSESGLVFVTVPNRLSLIERATRYSYLRKLRRGVVDRSGVAHVSFMSPGEWCQFFSSQGFRVLAHDMTLGVLVNDCFFAFFALATRTFVDPVLVRCGAVLGFRVKPYTVERAFYPRWLMARVDEVDQVLKRFLSGRWGWNLFVLSREATGSETLRLQREDAGLTPEVTQGPARGTA